MPLTSVSPVSVFDVTVNEGSSSSNLCRPANTFSSSPCFLAVTASEMQGSGNTGGVNATTLDAVQSVSPVVVCCSLASAPMSPATSLSTLIIFLPRIMPILFAFSVFSSLAFSIAMSDFSVPESTFIIDILPTNGSAMDFMTCAANGAAGSRTTSTSLPDLSFACAAGISAAEGISEISSSIRFLTPRFEAAAVAKTGAIVHWRTPSFSPFSISSFVRSCPSKYFSMSASSLPAAFSTSSSLYSSAIPARSAGISASFPSNIYAFMDTISTTPTNLSPCIIGTCTGVTAGAYFAFSASTAFP